MEKESIIKENNLIKIPFFLMKANDCDKQNTINNELEKKLKDAEQKIEHLQKIIKDKNIYIPDMNIESTDSIKVDENKYYIPICQERGCDGHLNILIFEESRLIKVVCEKDKNHNNNNILYETFEKFYLKEKIIQNCFKCSKNIESKDKYKCTKCEKLYCSSCFLLDTHIQKSWKNLKIISNKCPKDQNELTYYCVDCGQKVCLCCLKKYEENNIHKNHTIKSILKEMPSIYQLDTLKEKINKKSKAFDILLKSINEWQIEFNKKIDRLKQNLKIEIRILKKLFMNFNHDYIDYIYFTKFKEFFETLEDYNDENLEKFMKTPSFKEKSYHIFNILSLNKFKPKEENYKLKNIVKIGNDGIAENLTEHAFIVYSSVSSSIKLYKKEEDNEDDYEKTDELDFDIQIGSFTFSPDTKKIYACLVEKKQVIIFDYDQSNNTIELTDNILEIKTEAKSKFNKCICIKENCLITIDDCSIYLWSKKDINSKKFMNIKKITFENAIHDICQVNDNYILISQFSKLTFLNIENLNTEKIIENIDCTKGHNSLILINDYVLVNCQNGIAIISVKTKEMVQYVENLKNFKEKKIVKSLDDCIYIFNNFGDLYEYDFVDSTLDLISKIKIEKSIIDDTESDIDTDDIDFSNFNFFINNDGVLIWDESVYSLIYEED